MQNTIVFVMQAPERADERPERAGTPASPHRRRRGAPDFPPRSSRSRGSTPALLAALAVVGSGSSFRTTLGYELRAVGLGPRSAAQAGIDPKSRMVLGMFVAGGFAGLAGMVQVSGVFQRVYDGFSAGYRFDAIAVALLGKNSPIGIVFAALLFGAFARGGTIMQSNAHISSNLVAVIEALVLFVIAAETILRELARRGRPAAEKHA